MNKLTFLVLGSNGTLGSNIVKYLKKKKIKFKTVARKNSNYNIDLKKFKKLEKLLLNNKFDIVINCAAIIDIDKCEKSPKSTDFINCKLPKYLSNISKKFLFKLVHISTDHVYAGKFGILNTETSKIKSCNNYSKQKIKAEQSIKNNKNCLILRVNFTSNNKNSFVGQIIKSLKRKKKIYLFSDMYTSTLDVNTCAKYIVDLSLMHSKGVYNIGSKDMVSKKEFAIRMSKFLKKKIIYETCSNEVLKTKRGKNLGLNIDKLEKKLNIKVINTNKVITNLAKNYK